jgi:hypothetical protein
MISEFQNWFSRTKLHVNTCSTESGLKILKFTSHQKGKIRKNWQLCFLINIKYHTLQIQPWNFFHQPSHIQRIIRYKFYAQTWVVSPCSWASTQLAARATFQPQASRASLHAMKSILTSTLSAVVCRRLCKRANLMARWTSQFETLSAATQHSADIYNKKFLK